MANDPDYQHGSLEQLLVAAGPWYAVPERKYHNWDHAVSVHHTLLQLCPSVSFKALLAAVWHDAVYIPGSQFNELASADALCYTAKLLGSSEWLDMAEAAGTLVKSTSIATHQTPEHIKGELAYLLDADLHSLGAGEYCKFVERQIAIAEEWCTPYSFRFKETREVALRNQAAFLHDLRGRRSHLFHTQEARELFEVNAHNNILRFYQENC